MSTATEDYIFLQDFWRAVAEVSAKHFGYAVDIRPFPFFEMICKDISLEVLPSYWLGTPDDPVKEEDGRLVSVRGLETIFRAHKFSTHVYSANGQNKITASDMLKRALSATPRHALEGDAITSAGAGRLVYLPRFVEGLDRAIRDDICAAVDVAVKEVQQEAVVQQMVVDDGGEVEEDENPPVNYFQGSPLEVGEKIGFLRISFTSALVDQHCHNIKRALKGAVASGTIPVFRETPGRPMAVYLSPFDVQSTAVSVPAPGKVVFGMEMTRIIQSAIEAASVAPGCTLENRRVPHPGRKAQRTFKSVHPARPTCSSSSKGSS